METLKIDRKTHTSDLRDRVEAVIAAAFGRVEENLFSSGLLDSMRAVELGMLLEEEFGVRMSDLDINDLSSVSAIVDKVGSLIPVRKRK